MVRVTTLDSRTFMVRSRNLSTAVFPTDPNSLSIEFGFGAPIIVGTVTAQAGAAAVTIDADKIVQTEPAAQASAALAAISGQRVEVVALAVQAGVPAAVFDMQMVAQTAIVVLADPATTVILGENLGFPGALTHSIIFGPDVSHLAVRRDTTVVFRPDTGV